MATPANNLTLHRYKCTNKGYTEDPGDGVTLTLMLIPAGEFMMGAPESEPDSQDNERPQHLVKLPQFFMGRYPITQAQWRVVANYDRVDIDLDADPSRVKGDNLPVEWVTWDAALEFCKRLSARTGKNYHLPSEAQWEYACRAETDTAYHFGDKITPEIANFSRQVDQTTEVGNYPANRWGLYDMHGNVWEWCQDTWHENYQDAPTDGRAWIDSDGFSVRVLRGGSWSYVQAGCRAACRGRFENGTYVDTGLRVCCSGPRASSNEPG